MLKHLTDDFYRQSTETEALLQKAIADIREEHVPTAEATLRISTALVSLQNAYSAVRSFAGQKIPPEQMPDEHAPVSVYAAIINSKRMITEGILRAFLRAYTENERYADALNDAQEKAQALLALFAGDASAEPDVAPYKAFVDGVAMGDALDSDEGDLLLDIVEAYDKKLARGLSKGVFRIREEAASDAAQPAEARPQAPEAAACAQEDASPAVEADVPAEEDAPPAAEPIPAAPQEPPAQEQAQESPAAVPQEQTEDIRPEPPVEYIEASGYKAVSALPSANKVRETFNNTAGTILLVYIDDAPMITADLIKRLLPERAEGYDVAAWLGSCVNKGYLVAYTVDGRTYYAATRMLAQCIGKSERSKVLMEARNMFYAPNSVYRRKKMPMPLFVGEGRMRADELSERIAWTRAFEAMFKMTVTFNFWWEEEKKVYLLEITDEDKKRIRFPEIHYVLPQRYADYAATDVEAILAYDETLPDAQVLQTVACPNCLYYTDQLYRLEDGAWTAWNPLEGGQNEPPQGEAQEQSEAQNAGDAAMPRAQQDETADEAPQMPARETGGEADAAPGAQETPAPQTPAPQPETLIDTAPVCAPERTANDRETYLALAHKAYAQGRRGVGSLMLRALEQQHPEVRAEWLKWACASDDPAYGEARNATRLQEIYPEPEACSLADSALSIAAYIRMYFSGDAAREYWVRSLDTISSSPVLRRMGGLRALMQRLQSYVDAHQQGVDQATLIAIRKESGMEEKLSELKGKADEIIRSRLTETTVSNKRIKELFDVMFGSDALLTHALQDVRANHRSHAAQIAQRLEEIDPGLREGSQDAIDALVDEAWRDAGKRMRYRNTNEKIVGSGRNSAVNRARNALGVINAWVDLCLNSTTLSEQTIIAISGEVKHLTSLLPDAIAEVAQYKAGLRGDMAGYGALCILEDTLRNYQALVRGEKMSDERAEYYAEAAASDALAVETDGMPYIISREEMVMPYEQCGILAEIMETAPVEIQDGAQQFIQSTMVGVNPSGGNFSNGRYLLDRASGLTVNDETLFKAYTAEEFALRIKAASAIAAQEERKFHAHMEMAQSYGWLNSYAEQEAIERAAAAQCEMYKMIQDYAACIACMKRAFAWCRESARAANHDRLVADLSDVIRRYDAEEDNATINRIRKLIEQDCYTAATAEIRKIRSDGHIESHSSAMLEGKFDFFIQNFQSYYAAVSSLSTSLDRVFDTRNRNSRKGYVGTGREMLRMWPQSPEAIGPSSVRGILERLNLDVERVTPVDKPADGHAMVQFKPRTSMDFVHPIADFGTNMLEGGLDVFYLAGNKTADQIFDVIRTQLGKGVGHAAIFFMNSALTLSTRRQLTSKIWHELRSSRPLIIFDRVLALYVAESERIDRWNILLQCALPFAMVNPYTEKSSARQPPEMFVGRVQELRKLMSFGHDGANLVYGGRQLGKTAILRRVEQELHDPAAQTYVVFCDIKDKNAADAVRYVLLALQAKKTPGAAHLRMDMSWADLCFEIRAILTRQAEMKLMLLIDEADQLLFEDKASGYAALSEIKRVQDAFDGRFKFVLAGLHNVMRLHNEALDNNSDLPKLSHVRIKPLDYADAEMLLKKPLRYLGFAFDESEEQQALISMILSTTNYYPGLIHYYCNSLLGTISDGHTEAAPTRPPYVLDKKLILSLLQKKEFLEQTRQKFLMTLGIDKKEHQYYSILAHLMAYCYDENDAQVSGVSVEELSEAASQEGIEVISRLEIAQIETLLDELCELNILYCNHGAADKRYIFSRPAFRDMLGDADDVLAALLDYSDVKEVTQ